MVFQSTRPKDSESLLRKMLRQAGVDQACPDPAAAWEVFKRYAVVPVNCDRDYLFFQVGDGHPEYGLDRYFDDTREFEMRGIRGDEPVWFEQVHIEFKVPPRSGWASGPSRCTRMTFPTIRRFSRR